MCIRDSGYVVYTGALRDDTMREYIALHRRALAKSIACLTSLDTANALADILKSRYNERNTEPVSYTHLLSSRSAACPPSWAWTRARSRASSARRA